MNDLTAFQRDILYVIVGQGEPHGLAIKKTLEEYYSQEVNHGRLYPNLDDLVDQGLLDKGTKDKRTNEYTLTESGLHKLRARRDWEGQFFEDSTLSPL